MVKNLPDNAGDVRDVRLIPGSGRSAGERHGNPLPYSCLENPMDRGAIVHGVAKKLDVIYRLNNSNSVSIMQSKLQINTVTIDGDAIT